jgi:pimeloyl-ACP methyl ester carboxylesterase
MKQNTDITTVAEVPSADGTLISYERIGTGPSVVLVDGAFCDRSFGPARKLAEELASSFTVFFYDRRGRGGSGDTQPYAVQREIEDLAAVMTAAGGNPYVYAISSGAALALETAVSGIPIRKLAIFEAPYTGIGMVDGVPVDHAARLEQMLADNRRGAMVSYFLVKMIGLPAFVPLMLHIMPGVWKHQTAAAGTLPYETRVTNNFAAPLERLATIPVPTRVMVGGKAAPAMAAAQRTIAETIPGAEHRILDGQTHQVSEKAVSPHLIEFFTD